jgi:hypothetical protein
MNSFNVKTNVRYGYHRGLMGGKLGKKAKQSFWGKIGGGRGLLFQKPIFGQACQKALSSLPAFVIKI